jgi:hypothetical protein
MKEVMSKPERREQSRQHCIAINRDPEVRKRQVAGKRRTQKLAGQNPAPASKGETARNVDALFLQLLANEVRP